MPKGKPIDPNVKAEIVSKIRNDGMSVSEASTTYGVNAKSIYYWLRGVSSTATATSFWKITGSRKRTNSSTNCWAEPQPRCRSQKASHPGGSRPRMAGQVRTLLARLPDTLLPQANGTESQGRKGCGSASHRSCRAPLLRCRAAGDSPWVGTDQSPAYP